MKKQFRKDNYISFVSIASFLLLIFSVGLLIFQIFKVPKEVEAVVGTLNLNSQTTSTLNTPGGIWTSDGKLGIGTTSPNGKLEIATLPSNNYLDGMVIGQIDGDNSQSIQTYIDNGAGGGWATRTTYAGGCCNMLYIQKNAGDLTLGNSRGVTVTGPLSVGGTITAPTFSGALTGHASLDVAKTGDTMSGNLYRSAHSNGYFVGSYNNVGSNDAKSNPIYAIGSSYVPTDTTLSNMYGVGYSHSNFWGGGKSTGWGLYTSEAGVIHNTISDGGIWTSGTLTVSGNSNICNLVTYTSGSGTTSCPAGFYTYSGVGLTSGQLLCCKVSNPI